MLPSNPQSPLYNGSPSSSYQLYMNNVNNAVSSGLNLNDTNPLYKYVYSDSKGNQHYDWAHEGVDRLSMVFSDLVNGARDATANAGQTLSNIIQDGIDGKGNGSGVRSRSSGGRTPIDYFNAPLATRYGMNATTAYQEALSNTAHQREVADLQAAGLNPILSTRYGGSAGVSGATALSYGSGSGFGFGNSNSGNLEFGKVAQIAGTVFGVISAAKTGHLSNIVQGANAGKAIGSLFE